MPQLRPPRGVAQAALPLARKDAALLAYVALEGATPSLHLATLLWGDTGQRGAMNNLRQRLHRLRKASGARLLEMNETLALAADLQLAQPDLAAWLQAEEAAPLPPLLQGLEFDDTPDFAHWLARRRSEQLNQQREALGRQAAEAEAAGQLVGALASTRRLLLLDGLSEHAHRRLMRLHYLRGDRAAAITAFEACEALLKGELGLKPSAETLDLLATIESGPAAPAQAPLAPPAGLLRPPRLIGREQACARLAEAWQRCETAVVVGEAGLGKSRLLQEFVAGRADVVLAQARPGDAAVPYGTLARLLRRLADRTAPPAREQEELAVIAVGAHATDAAARPAAAVSLQRLQAAWELRLGEALGAGLRLLVLDDLHFADAASIEMLLALTQSDALRSLGWFLAHRPVDNAQADAALLQALAEAPQTHWIRLQPLETPALHEFVASLGLPGLDAPALRASALVPALARHAGGNPLHLLETLRAALQAGQVDPAALPRPLSLAHLFDQRLRRLSAPALALARVAAVAGADFDIELAEAVLGASALALADAWQELEAAQVLNGPAFAHDLMQDAALRATPTTVATRVHRLAAGCLQARQAEPARVAGHWLAGGEPLAAAQAFFAAADRAEQASRPREQGLLLLQAAAAFDAGGDRAAALVARARAVAPTVVSDGVAPALALSEANIAAASDDAAAGCAWCAHATVLIWAGGRGPDAERAASRALALLPPDDAPRRLEATLALGMACGSQGRHAEGLDLLRPLWARIEDIASLESRVELCGALSMLLVQAHRNGEALAVVHKQLRYSRQIGSATAELNCLLSLVFVHGRRGDVAEAIAAGEEAHRLGRGGPELAALASSCDTVLAEALCGAGRFAEALGIALPAVERARAQAPGTNFHAIALTSAAQAYLHLGQAGRVPALLQVELPGENVDGTTLRLWLLAQASQALGSTQAPALLARAAQHGAERRNTGTLLAEVALCHIEGSTAAAERCRRLMDEAQDKECLHVAAAAAVARLACLLAAAGSSLGAADVLQAERLARRYRSGRTYLPQQLQVCACAYASLGQHEDAQRCLQDATQWLQQCLATQVPAEFRDSFIYRNPHNAALLRAVPAVHAPAGACSP